MNENEIDINKEFFITTYDNPFDYFTQFDEWLAYDRTHEYYTLEYIARLIRLAPDLSDEEENLEYKRVFESMLEWNGDFYKIIYKKN